MERYRPTSEWDGFRGQTRPSGDKAPVRLTSVGGSAQYPWEALLFSMRYESLRIRQEAVRDYPSAEGRANLVPTRYPSGNINAPMQMLFPLAPVELEGKGFA